MLKTDNERPIFMQVAQSIEDAIIEGVFAEETQVPSIVDFAVAYKINPNTALKGVNKLVDDNILYKKRGIGMFVARGAVQQLTAERTQYFADNIIDTLVIEAKQLKISLEQIQNMIKVRYEK